jgi:hypothetical protein
MGPELKQGVKAFKDNSAHLASMQEQDKLLKRIVIGKITYDSGSR